MNRTKSFNELTFLRAEVKRLRKALMRQSPGIDVLLKRRGFKVYKKEPGDDLLVPSKKYLAGYYRMLHKYSFRLLLRDVIKHQECFALEDVTLYATPEVTREYLEYLLSVRLIKKLPKGYTLARGPITS